MGKLVLKGKRAFIAGIDISRESNRVEIDPNIEELDSTAMLDLFKNYEGGLEKSAISLGGFVEKDADASDALPTEEELFENIRGSVVGVSFFPEDGSVGSVGFTVAAQGLSYQPGLQIGQLFSFTVELSSEGELLVRGKVAEIGTAEYSATGAGNGVEVGAASASQRLYAGLHILELAGTSPTVDAIVETEATSAFTAPTTRITLPQFTEKGYASGSAAGSITDTWARFNFTVGGTTPTFKAAGVIGVQ